MTNDKDGKAVLAEVERKRGYTLPYHRMLAATDPELLAAYDAYYERLTLRPRALTAHERETVWAALQAAAREWHGSIHLKRAVKAGMNQDQIVRSLAIAACVESWEVLGFAAKHWAEWSPADKTVAAYLRLFEAAARDVEPAIAEITAAVCHAARRTHDGMALHLERAFKAGATVPKVSEALSFMLLPCGGPALIDAVSAWESAAKSRGFSSPY